MALNYTSDNQEFTSAQDPLFFFKFKHLVFTEHLSKYNLTIVYGLAIFSVGNQKWI